MGRTLPAKMGPGQTGHVLGMARHYRTPSTRNKAPLRAGSPPPSQAGLGKTQTTGSLPGETNGLPESNRMAQANTERQVRSRGMPHVGHADSVMNDERRSRSDISNRSYSNPITRVIKVTLPTPTISLYDHSFIYCHSYIHTCIHTFIHTNHSFIPYI